MFAILPRVSFLKMLPRYTRKEARADINADRATKQAMKSKEVMKAAIFAKSSEKSMLSSKVVSNNYST